MEVFDVKINDLHKASKRGDEMKSILTGAALEAALKALEEGRLWWRCSDQYGRSCNGGSKYRLPPSSPGCPGEWAPRVDDVRICSSGYHATSDPIKWTGLRVALVEVETVVEREDDKIVTHTIREIGAVDLDECVDVRIWVAASRPCLSYTDLGGVNLKGANLKGANLKGANLKGANLKGANLEGANLKGANLKGANLWRADLWGADLKGANLKGANLKGADLWGADLWGADLKGANLEGADLWRANLEGADLGEPT